MGKLKADRLKKRADFLRAQKGIRKSSAGLTLEICATPDAIGREPLPPDWQNATGPNGAFGPPPGPFCRCNPLSVPIMFSSPAPPR